MRARTLAFLYALVIARCDAAPVVDKLRALLSSNPQLNVSVAYTLRTVPSDSQWIAAGHGRDLRDLYDFFDAWAAAVVVPSAHSAASSAVVQSLGVGAVPSMCAWSELPTPVTFTLPMWSLAFSTGNAVWSETPPCCPGSWNSSTSAGCSWTPGPRGPPRSRPSGGRRSIERSTLSRLVGLHHSTVSSLDKSIVTTGPWTFPRYLRHQTSVPYLKADFNPGSNFYHKHNPTLDHNPKSPK